MFFRLLLGEIAIPPIITHYFVAWSVVCHIRALCLNRFTDSDAFWQLHLRDLLTHCIALDGVRLHL